MIAVSPGIRYTDIDGLGCAVAYAELLRSEGREAKAVLPGPLNGTITPTVLSWKPQFDTDAPANAQLVIVDVSEPGFIANWRDPKQVIEVFDHHAGAEAYWRERIGDKSHIEFIGAACTLVYEEIERRGFADKLSQTSARLLYTGILSNTLYFRADLTSPRDHQAFDKLGKTANLPETWPARYFRETETGIMAGITKAAREDTKDDLAIPNLGLTIAISQLELWDAKDLVVNHQAEIKVAHDEQKLPWFHTSPSISEGKNYLYTENITLKTVLEQAIGAKFVGNVGQTPKMYLRKEILSRLYKLK
jgi:hypothetical protein